MSWEKMAKCMKKNLAHHKQLDIMNIHTKDKQQQKNEQTTQTKQTNKRKKDTLKKHSLECFLKKLQFEIEAPPTPTQSNRKGK